jgi:hypothetical protein
MCRGCTACQAPSRFIAHQARRLYSEHNYQSLLAPRFEIERPVRPAFVFRRGAISLNVSGISNEGADGSPNILKLFYAQARTPHAFSISNDINRDRELDRVALLAVGATVAMRIHYIKEFTPNIVKRHLLGTLLAQPALAGAAS